MESGVLLGRMCWMMRRRLETNESENSAPFSVNTFLKDWTVLCVSDRWIMYSAGTENLIYIDFLG